jgi:hypothetical protein
MQRQTSTGSRRRAARVLFAGACVAVTVGATGTAAHAEQRESCASPTGTPYQLKLSALTGPGGADLTIAVERDPACAAVEALKKVQLKIFAEDGSVDDVRNLNDVQAPGGIATIELGNVARNRDIEADVLVQSGTPERTYVLRGDATTLLRPDLTIASLETPARTLSTRTINVRGEIAELNGDVGATATVTLSWGPTVLATQSATVAKGGRTSVLFSGIALTSPVPVELTLRLSDASPAETDATNNARSATVDVTEHELARSRLLVPSLGGYGAQLNQHVYASITSAPPGSFPDLEAKVKALEPQLVRIFFNEIQERTPDRMASFIETVELAHQAGATINITYQTAANAKLQPDRFMGEFAAILDNLVRTRGFTNLRWVTVQNEPNSTLVTLEQYNALYRALHAHLVARGLRTQIGLMGGDLVENGPPNAAVPNHRAWFQYMAQNMNDVLDAYSIHIYWNYWDVPRMEFRLKDVRKIVTEELPENARKPTYITELGVRGIQNVPGKPVIQPGYWQDGTQLSRTNIAAFQQLWFNLASAQMGFTGAVKWDAYWGKYDAGNQAYWMIGPAEEGWPLFPAYHAIRMLLQTTQRGWQVLGVEPWTDDDWLLGTSDQPEKEIAAYAGPNGELTLIGLDSRGRDLNAASADMPAYSIGGLPPHAVFNLAVWNVTANGENGIAGTVTTNAAGVARFEAPLHGAFALTTVQIS